MSGLKPKPMQRSPMPERNKTFFFLTPHFFYCIIPTKIIAFILEKDDSTVKLSTRGRYGVRAALDLAIHYGKGPISLKDVAQRQSLSPKYLEQLLVALKRAGILKSIRGAYGGYELAKHPSEVRLSEVMQTLEGPISPVECLTDPEDCERVGICAARDVWKRMKTAIDSILESTTLEDLVKQQKQKEQSEETMYYI